MWESVIVDLSHLEKCTFMETSRASNCFIKSGAMDQRLFQIKVRLYNKQEKTNIIIR